MLRWCHGSGLSHGRADVHRHELMIELLVTYPGLVFIGLAMLVVLDTVSGNLPPAALVPFALGTVVAVILL